MSLAGVRSNRGDGYQTVVAMEWVIAMLLDESILAIEVDTTALVGSQPATVDDIVVRYADGHGHYFQCKKNQNDFDAWTTKLLAPEFVKAAALLTQEPSATVTFYSRNNFGLVAKLREHAQTQPDHKAFLGSLTPSLLVEHHLLCACLGGAAASSSSTLSLLLRIEFETTSSVERMIQRNKATLARHLTHAEAAHSAIWTTVDQLGARIVRTSGSVHSLTRADLMSALELHACRALPNALGGRLANGTSPAFATDDSRLMPAAVREALTALIDAVGGSAEEHIEDWKARYEALLEKLQAQAPESDLRHAGQALAGGDYAQAEKHLDAAIRVGRESARMLGTAYHTKGELHLLKFEQKDALENFRLALHSNPDNADFVTNYSSMLTELGEFGAAATVLRSAIASPPDDATAAIWHCGLATALFAMGDSKGAQQNFATAEKFFVTGEFFSGAERANLINGLYINRGLLYESQDSQADALCCYQMAVKHFRAAVQAAPSTELRLSLAQALNNLALHSSTSQDVEEPGKLYLEARSMLLAEGSWKAVRDLTLISVNYADYLINREEFGAAEQLLNDSLAVRRAAMAQGGWHASTSYDLCDSLLALASLHHRWGHARKALAMIEEIRAQIELLRSNHPTMYGKVLARYYANATAIYRNNGQFEDALDCADEAVRFFRKQPKSLEVLADLATVLNNKANVLTEMRSVQAAGEAHAEAMLIRRQLAQSGHHVDLSEYAMSLSAHAVLLTDMAVARQNLDEARKILGRLARDYPKIYTRHWANFLNNECLEYIKTNDFAKAIESGQLAVEEFQRLDGGRSGPHAGDTASSLCNLSIAYERGGEMGKAIDCLMRSKAIYEVLATTGDPRFNIYLARVYENLCLVHLADADRSSALGAQRRAIEILEAVRASENQSFADYIGHTMSRLNTMLAS